jgi:hypothetical protein
MDEVIKNFCQYWPMYDLPFEPVDDDSAADDVNSASVAAAAAADLKKPAAVETQVHHLKRDNGNPFALKRIQH